ncbi:MAG: LPS export ABC transporter periplasmic protein LptC [Verrucomicrobiae bacterium]|nr:LPS export ABC transporter periplasmic protein LptC [Verrucomicrobiae bacterium]
MRLSPSLTLGLALTLFGAAALTGAARLMAQASDGQDKPAIARPDNNESTKSMSIGEDQSDSEEPAETDEVETESNNLNELIPIGRIFEGVKIPSYSGDTLSSVVHAAFMRRADDEHLEMEMLEIVVYDGEEPDSRILTDRAIYDMEAKTLRSTTPAKIIQKQFEMTGDRMIFDSTTRIGHMFGNVKTRIFQVNELMKSEES